MVIHGMVLIPYTTLFRFLRLLKSQMFYNYWFETGTPTFLIKLIKNSNYDVTQFENTTVSMDIFDSHDIDNLGIKYIILSKRVSNNRKKSKT